MTKHTFKPSAIKRHQDYLIPDNLSKRYQVVSPWKVSRFAPLNHYYIIIDEVFFDNFLVIIYLLVVYKKNNNKIKIIKIYDKQRS